jgi:hypothetical protein
LQNGAATPLGFGGGWLSSSALSHPLSSLCSHRPMNPEVARQGRRLLDCGAAAGSRETGYETAFNWVRTNEEYDWNALRGGFRGKGCW